MGRFVSCGANGLIVDFWMLGVLAWLTFFFFAWFVVWSMCCLLGVLLCKCVIQWLQSPPLRQADTAHNWPKDRSGPGFPVVRQFPHGVGPTSSLKTGLNSKRYNRGPTPSGGFAPQSPQRPPGRLSRMRVITAEVASTGLRRRSRGTVSSSSPWPPAMRISRRK
jgi:hypothetical protein